MSSMPLGGSFNSTTSATGKQAGVGLLLSEVENSNVVIVKQVVPRGSADRTGQVKVGYQVIRVGGTEVVGMNVTDVRNIIVGDQGTRVPIRFRKAENGEIFEIDLVRGTPEYLDQANGYTASQPSSGQQMYHAAPQGPSLYSSGGGGRPMHMGNMKSYMLGTTWSKEMFNAMPPPQQSRTVVHHDPARSLAEENEWLRSALRMAESTMMKHRQDLGGCREMFVQSKVETEARVKQMEEQNRAKDDERRESEQALLAAEEYRRSLEVKLREAQRRSEWMRETDAQIAENERARHDYLGEVKRRADSEKVEMEQELQRLQDDLRQEKVARADAEQREASLRSDFNRLGEHRTAEPASRGSYGDLRGSYDTNIGESMGGYSNAGGGGGGTQSELMLA